MAGQNNKAFVADDHANGISTISAKISKNKINGATLDLGLPLPQDDYNPYQHRKVKHPTTNFETLIHLLKGALGTGILAMPNALHRSGYVVGLIGTIIIGIICTHCVHILIQAEYELCKRKKVPLMNYAAVAEHSFSEGPNWLKPYGPIFGKIINASLIVYLVGASCVYVLFVASNIKVLVDYAFDIEMELRTYMWIILLPLIMINLIKKLKFYAPFSTVGNAITMVSFAIIGYYIFRDPITFEGKQPVGSISEFPLFFGTVLFALEAIYVILPLENEMKEPQYFGGPCGVLNVAMMIIVFLYIAMGFFGYLNYGENIQASITLNLPNDEILAQSVKGLLAFAIFISHGLACFVASDVAWDEYVEKRFATSPRLGLYESLTRVFIVLTTFFLAILIPNLEIFISLVGSVCLSALGIAVPALIETCVFWNSKSGVKRTWMISKNIFIGIIALAGLVIGLYTSVTEIIETYF